MDNIRAMGNVRVAIRTCLDTLLNSSLNSTGLDPKSIGNMIDIQSQQVCINGQLQMSGANGEGTFCICQTDRCNSNGPKQTVAAGAIPAPIIDSSYTGRQFFADND